MTEQELTKHLIAKQKFLYHSAYQLTKQRDDALDLAQTVILKALTQYEKITNAINLNGWLYTIMKNVFLNQCRTSHEVHLTTKDCADEPRHEITLKASDSADSRCIMQDITHAIDTLEKEYRIPFGLYIAGYKYEEISAKIGIPLGTVKSRIFVARKKAQGYLRDEKTGSVNTPRIIVQKAYTPTFDKKERSK